jgi:hypothetical protein
MLWLVNYIGDFLHITHYLVLRAVYAFLGVLAMRQISFLIVFKLWLGGVT